MEQEDLKKQLRKEIARLKAKGYSQETIDNMIGKIVTAGLQDKSKKEILRDLVMEQVEKEGGLE